MAYYYDSKFLWLKPQFLYDVHNKNHTIVHMHDV